MARHVGVIAAVSIMATAVLFASAPIVGATRPPVSNDERDALRQVIQDSQWARVAHQYPEAIRPDVPVARTVADEDFVRVIAACLEGNGFVVTVSPGGVDYSTSTGQSPLDFSVSGYSCSARFPPLTSVVRLLNEKQLTDLYSYWANVVHPCLVLAGERTDAPPTREAILEGAAWDPYAGVGRRQGGPDVTRLLRSCPPVPGWLDLGSGR